METFYLGSKNKSKVEGLKNAILKVKGTKDYVVQSVPVQPSGPQPIGREQTYEYAEQRLDLMKKTVSGDGFFVVAEGGVEMFNNATYTFGVVIVEDTKKNKKVFTETARCPIPAYMYQKLKQDPSLELGSLIDEFANEQGTKQFKGAVGIFTKGNVTRKDLFEQAFIIALSLIEQNF